MSINLPSSRKWATLNNLASVRGTNERTARRWANKGYFPLYRIAGVLGVVVDLDEANAALDALAEEGRVRPQYGTFNGQPVIHVVEAVER